MKKVDEVATSVLDQFKKHLDGYNEKIENHSLCAKKCKQMCANIVAQAKLAVKDFSKSRGKKYAAQISKGYKTDYEYYIALEVYSKQLHRICKKNKVKLETIVKNLTEDNHG